MMPMQKPTVFHNRLATISVSNWEMVVLAVAFLDRFTTDRTFAFRTFQDLPLLILIEGALGIESDADGFVHFLAPKPIVLGDLRP